MPNELSQTVLKKTKTGRLIERDGKPHREVGIKTVSTQGGKQVEQWSGLELVPVESDKVELTNELAFRKVNGRSILAQAIIIDGQKTWRDVPVLAE